jgi:hypothetical protein
MTISEEIRRLNLPPILKFADGRDVTAENWPQRREEILRIFEEHEYGHTPRGPFEVTGKLEYKREDDYANKVLTEKYTLTVRDTAENVSFSFPVVFHTPYGGNKKPLFILINFRDQTPDEYMPVEEITDRGAAVAMIYYNDVAEDANDDFKSGVGPLYPREKYDWSKIGMWAWSMSRTLDFALSLGRYDERKTACIGHSRLGKTSLWCGAQDERFKYVFVNDSGCSGDAVTRGKTGERIVHITDAFPVWSNEKYKEYRGREEEMPFDQHMLVAAVAPRHVYGGTAVLDTWADPYSQYMSYFLANEVYRMLGMKPADFPDRRPDTGERFMGGDIGFHMRHGAHFFSREDWQCYLNFMEL